MQQHAAHQILVSAELSERSLIVEDALNRLRRRHGRCAQLRDQAGAPLALFRRRVRQWLLVRLHSLVANLHGPLPCWHPFLAGTPP